jgi:hypothetical protein
MIEWTFLNPEEAEAGFDLGRKTRESYAGGQKSPGGHPRDAITDWE